MTATISDHRDDGMREEGVMRDDTPPSTTIVASGETVQATSRTRRSQAERRRDMIDLLIEATLDSLQASGYHGASLGDILGRAGVSRGAWAHYYTSKTEMVAAAAERMLRLSVEQAGNLSDPTAPPSQRLASMMEEGWRRFYQGRHRDVLFELTVACRTDAELRDRLAPIFRDFLAALGQAWRQNLTSKAHQADDPMPSVSLTLFMLRGMAMQEIIGGSDPGHAPLRQYWAALMERSLLPADKQD